MPVVLGQSWILALALGASVVIWCVFALQDAVLTGVRQAVWVPLENGLYGIGKIALLVALAPVTPEYGIVVSWFLPALVLLPPVDGRSPAAAAAPPRRAPGRHDRHTIARFIGGDYLGSIFALAAVDLLPVLVVARLGAADAAYFYLPFLIVYSIELVAVNLGVSLTVEGAPTARAWPRWRARCSAASPPSSCPPCFFIAISLC